MLDAGYAVQDIVKELKVSAVTVREVRDEQVIEQEIEAQSEIDTNLEYKKAKESMELSERIETVIPDILDPEEIAKRTSKELLQESIYVNALVVAKAVGDRAGRLGTEVGELAVCAKALAILQDSIFGSDPTPVESSSPLSSFLRD